MLTHLRVKNFKAWEDTGAIRLAPLTVIFGTNSAGKSSLGHLLLALKQTALSVDRRKALHLGDTNSLIDLGTYEDCVYQHDLNKSIGFELGWHMPAALKIEENQHNHNYEGNHLQISVDFDYTKQNHQISIKSLKYELRNDNNIEFNINYSRKKKNSQDFNLESDSYKFKKTHGRVWSLDEPEKFYHITEQARSRYQNASFLGDFALKTEEILKNIYYLGPLREYPKRLYQWAGDTPEDVGKKGEYAIAAILAATSENRRLNRNKKRRLQDFSVFIAEWLKQLGLIHTFSVKPIADGRKEHEVLIKTHSHSAEVKITDIGFGISQVLPTLVQAFYAPRNSTILMEQPEIHLHPSVQSGLADVFISAIYTHERSKPRNVQLVIESHSEHFLTRLQRRIAEEIVSPEEVAIYFVDNQNGKASIEELRINEYGEIENWPENFFGDEMGDLAAQTLATIERRQRNQNKG